jgi:tubulin polyglutamylase TTLL4
MDPDDDVEPVSVAWAEDDELAAVMSIDEDALTDGGDEDDAAEDGDDEGIESERALLLEEDDGGGSSSLSPAQPAPAAAAGAAALKSGSVPIASCVQLLPSCFPHRPPTIFFELPAGLPPREERSAKTALAPRLRVERSKVRCELAMRLDKNANSVRLAFKRAGFTVLPASKKEAKKKEAAAAAASEPLVCWARHTGEKLWTELPLGSVVNHWPGSWTLGRKDGLSRILYDQRKRLGGSEYSFVPRTFTLPQDRPALVKALESGRLGGGGAFIVKPLNSSRGRGVYMCADLSEIDPDAKVLVQEYIDNPYLLQQRKFDLRIYVLVTSFEPLRAYTFEQGLARFATQPYEPPSADDVGERCAHLTNYSINKKEGDFIANESAEDDDVGHKWSLAAAFRALAEEGVDVVAVRKRIDALLAKTLIAAQPHVSQKYGSYFRRRGACFEVFGFDVMLDSDARPWLIEVNVSPDLSSSSPLDRQLKGALASDVLQVVGIRAPEAYAAACGCDVLPAAPRYESPPLFSRQFHNGHHLNELPTTPLSSLSREELELLVECEEEFTRAAHTGFRRVYPPLTDGQQQKLIRLHEQAKYSDTLLNTYCRRPDRLEELHHALSVVPTPTGTTSSSSSSAAAAAAAVPMGAAAGAGAALSAGASACPPPAGAGAPGGAYAKGSGGASRPHSTPGLVRGLAALRPTPTSHLPRAQLPRQSASSRSASRSRSAQRRRTKGAGGEGGGKGSPLVSPSRGGGGASGRAKTPKGRVRASSARPTFGGGGRLHSGGGADSVSSVHKQPAATAVAGAMRRSASRPLPPRSSGAEMPRATGAPPPSGVLAGGVYGRSTPVRPR